MSRLDRTSLVVVQSLGVEVALTFLLNHFGLIPLQSFRLLLGMAGCFLRVQHTYDIVRLVFGEVAGPLLFSVFGSLLAHFDGADVHTHLFHSCLGMAFKLHAVYPQVFEMKENLGLATGRYHEFIFRVNFAETEENWLFVGRLEHLFAVRHFGATNQQEQVQHVFNRHAVLRFPVEEHPEIPKKSEILGLRLHFLWQES